MNPTPDWKRPVELSPDALTDPDNSDSKPQISPVSAPREIPPALAQDTNDNPPDEVPVRAPARKRSRRWLWGALGVLASTAIGTEVYRLISWSNDIHPLLGAGFAALTFILTCALGIEVHRGLRGNRQLKQVHALQQQAQTLLTQSSHGNSTRLTRQLGRQYHGTVLQRELQSALQQLDSSYNDQEIVQYLDRHALSQADTAARRCVQRYSIESGVLVAFSPWASFDMLLVAWRNLRMLREVAAIYGIASGPLTQGRLLKQVLQNLAFAGASELSLEAGSALLGSSLTASLSARAGQGLGAGLFTARTGLAAIRLCRPLPAQHKESALPRKIAKSIVQQLTARQNDTL
ncbi:TIGR01620 family protein [Marinobacterium marinum]|uniref:TIGR01620 family protein n=1 Tax=Marinobacterium marinum TaxID=2756129 RepID=A0A7W1WW06_9GAMM|nr:TIGR01620 family protein [Marinobacterium marinum]MBA4501260.1 TIGR01620 family protein [Marinobacterium marinum]